MLIMRRMVTDIIELQGKSLSKTSGGIDWSSRGAEELIFSSIIECAKYLNEDRNRVARYKNSDKVLKCHNGKNFYVKEL